MKRIIILLLCFMILVVGVNAEAVKQEATNALNDAEKTITQMQTDGFETNYVNDILIDAEYAFKSNDYNLTIEKTNLIILAKANAYEISDQLVAMRKRIDDLAKTDINTDALEKTYSEAKQYFDDENYSRALEKINELQISISESETQYRLFVARLSVLRSNVINRIQDNWKTISVAIGTISLIVYILYKRFSKIFNETKIKSLQRENMVIKKLMIKAQKNRYVNMNLSEREYEAKMDKYRNRLDEIKNEIAVLKKLEKKVN